MNSGQYVSLISGQPEYAILALMLEEIIKVKIESIAAGGAGAARYGNKNIFIERVVPGETVICRIAEDRRCWSLADLLDVTEPSPDRVQPVCAYYGICGGCNMQHMNYPAQLATKTSILKDAFSRIGGIDCQ